MTKAVLLGCAAAAVRASVLAVAMASAHAESSDADRIHALELRLEQSQKLIEQLAARIAALEGGARVAAPSINAAASAPAITPEEQGRSIAALQESVNQIANGLSRGNSDAGVPVHGFMDVGAGWSTSTDPKHLRGFNAGSLDLYLTPQIGPRVKSLFELVVEFDDDNSASIDMERGQLGYTFSDALTVWAGRFHTPFGIWNTSFHHGANLQTSITRPTLVEFEDHNGLIPAHSVGIWGSGRVPVDAGRLTYDAYVANGPSIRDRRLDVNAFTDDNSNRMVGGNLGIQASGPQGGLTLGLHAFGSTVDAYVGESVVSSRTRLRAYGGYFGYDADRWEALGEVYRFRDSDVASGLATSSTAGLVQLGRALGAFTPYVRYERASLDSRDNYFRSLRSGRSFTSVSLGTRYALDANSSLKVELRRTHESAARMLGDDGLPFDSPELNYSRALFQFSIAF